MSFSKEWNQFHSSCWFFLVKWTFQTISYCYLQPHALNVLKSQFIIPLAKGYSVHFQAHWVEQHSSQMHICCCLLYRRMQLTWTAWVQSVNHRDDCRANTYTSCQKHESVRMYGLSLPPFVKCFVYNKPKVKSVPSYNHREY